MIGGYENGGIQLHHTGAGNPEHGAGALGTAAFAGVGAGNGNGIGLFGGNRDYAYKSDVDNSVVIASKDAEIALLKSNAATDAKLVEVYNAAAERDKNIRADFQVELKELRESIRAEHEAQGAINSAQAVYNCSNNSAVTLLQAQVAQLSGMTKLVIPSENVCPQPMPLLNKWVAPTT